MNNAFRALIEAISNNVIDRSEMLESEIRDTLQKNGAGLTKAEKKSLDALEEIIDTIDVQETLRISLDIDFKTWYINRLTEMANASIYQPN